MSEITIGFIGIGVLLGAIFFGAPIMLALTAVGFLGLGILTSFSAAITVLGTIYFETVSSFHFSVIPMFLLMGFFAMEAGIGNDLFEACTKWFGNLPGGLAIATTGAAAAFGAASGSSVGSAMLFTKLALPEMIKRGYDRGFSSACIAIAGTLAVLIPPSALMVVYGILTNSSIGELLIAGIIPGIIFAFLIGVTVFVYSFFNPEKTPRMTEKYTFSEKVKSLRYILPLVVVIVTMILGLYNGFFTPEEAGGIGALVTFVMAVIRNKRNQFKTLLHTLIETSTLTAMIFAIIIGGLLFARFLALSGVSEEIKFFLTETGLSNWVVVFLVTLLYLLFGMLMDAPSLLAISLPITYPVMTTIGFDPLWLGVYVIVLAEIGAITPPVGMNCFVVNGAANGLVKLEEIFKGLLPYLWACSLMLLLLVLFPEIVLYLPQKMK